VFFQTFGKVPCSRDKLKICTNGSRNTLLQSFTRKAGMLSLPYEIFGSSCSNAFSMSDLSNFFRVRHGQKVLLYLRLWFNVARNRRRGIHTHKIVSKRIDNILRSIAGDVTVGHLSRNPGYAISIMHVRHFWVHPQRVLNLAHVGVVIA
jgi:hypothetical protein